MRFITRFLQAYDYASTQEFLYSLFPSFKYQLQWLMVSLSLLGGLVNYVLGITPAVAVAMLVAVVVEVWTGIQASKKLQVKFESFRFSRCWIKVVIWLLILYIIHAFEKEFANDINLFRAAAKQFFSFMFVAALTGFLVEYITSILENVSVMSGKPKTKIIEVIQAGWMRFVEAVKGGVK